MPEATFVTIEGLAEFQAASKVQMDDGDPRATRPLTDPPARSSRPPRPPRLADPATCGSPPPAGAAGHTDERDFGDLLETVRRLISSPGIRDIPDPTLMPGRRPQG